MRVWDKGIKCGILIGYVVWDKGWGMWFGTRVCGYRVCDGVMQVFRWWKGGVADLGFDWVPVL